MDVYCENLVKRKFTPQDKKKIKTLFVTLIASSVLFILIIPAIVLKIGLAYITTVSMAIYVVIIILIWRTLKKMQLEYEYIITNDTLDVDKIIAQKKRERQISLELKSVEEVGIFDEKAFGGRNFDYIVRAEKNLLDKTNLYMLISHPEYKRTLIVLTPDDKMLDALRKTLNPRVSRALPQNSEY